jgi:3-methyladenine DNA glycosylase AlkD
VADHACEAGNRRIMADLTRLDVVEGWTTSDHLWTRRAALVITLPLTKANHPSPEERRARERVLGWAAEYVADPEWFIQKSVAWWLRDLSRHDGARVRDFLAEHGAGMKGFARKEAAKFL